ncbi:hypothetical protein E0F15_17795 [Frankia sp. B2]|uniref:hypothetical protein n=1 Tax=unclassified Frankia TaxID=2632575 RepID=UPI0006CA41C8|nr:MULTISPECIES: hypothetical protein [unclassified Frankia]TFE26492.1 hypothetical protein E0F15_17795 [Frankia sp. B2]
MSRPPGRRAARPDELRRRPVNRGGPPTDDDRLDASALLAPLTGGHGERLDALRAAGIGDHTMPGYDPDRVLRVLVALRDRLTDDIDTWAYSHVSRAGVEQHWREILHRGDCARCTRSCHSCAVWADALGLERVDDDGRPVWHPRPTAAP